MVNLPRHVDAMTVIAAVRMPCGTGFQAVHVHAQPLRFFFGVVSVRVPLLPPGMHLLIQCRHCVE
eukprot:COSAG02_NODE_526_length_20707_cov_11.431337_19_plen_65_part_00